MLPVDRWHATVLNGPAEAPDLARRAGSWCPSSPYPTSLATGPRLIILTEVLQRAVSSTGR